MFYSWIFQGSILELRVFTRSVGQAERENVCKKERERDIFFPHNAPLIIHTGNYTYYFAFKPCYLGSCVINPKYRCLITIAEEVPPRSFRTDSGSDLFLSQNLDTRSIF